MERVTNFGGGVAVITGAASGIGAALVAHAAGLGMKVALADVDFDTIRKRVAELDALGVEAMAKRVDVTNPDDVESLAHDVYREWNTTTILVNNAGIELHGNTWEIPVEMWQRVVDVNLNGVFYGMRSFIPRMISQGTTAHVVTMSSVAALRTNPGTSAYAATKHANLALTECVAKELASVTENVHLTAVLPGPVKTAIFENAMTADNDGVGAESKKLFNDLLHRDGIKPRIAARMIFDGAARRDLRVHTDPAISRGLIEERADDLAFWRNGAAND